MPSLALLLHWLTDLLTLSMRGQSTSGLTCVHFRRCAVVARVGPIATPSARHARCRAAEVTAVLTPARPLRQSLLFVPLGVTSLAEPPVFVTWRVCSPCYARLRHPLWRQPVRQATHRSPPTASPSFVRGTFGGMLKRWPGKLAHCLGCVWNSAMRIGPAR